MAGITPPPSASTTTTTTPSTLSSHSENTTFQESEISSPIDFHNIKAASDTIKKNPKLEFSQPDLLKLLSHLEGELQARDVVIAALKSENVKQFIYAARYKPLGLNDPFAAMFRDNLASSGNIVSRQSSTAAAQSEQGMRLYARQQLEQLENAVLQQRHTHLKLINIMKDTEEKHKHLMHELEEEKQKHERDTAQGDDITYGLEIERTRLKQDLESEKETLKKMEKDLKKAQEQLEAERARQKPIVLLLLAERKRIIMKYIEERKRSEDLAQILSEEKQRVDTIAEGLEEESKKSLRMEAELEKQMQSFEIERKQYKATLASDEKKLKDQELEITQLKMEMEVIRKQQRSTNQAPQLPLKSSGINSRAISDALDESSGPMMSSVAKVVQPTSTVSSVPVSGPTTGIARSISPGQSLRQTPNEISTFNASGGGGGTAASKVAPRKLSNASSATSATATPLLLSSSSSVSSALQSSTLGCSNTSQAINNPLGKTILTTGSAAGATASSASSSTTATPAPATATISSHATIKKNPAAPPIGRGVPPPIPPNKPVVPPKREPSATRLLAATNTSATSSGLTPTKDTNKDHPAASVTSNNSSEDTITAIIDDLHDFQQINMNK